MVYNQYLFGATHVLANPKTIHTTHDWIFSFFKEVRSKSIYCTNPASHLLKSELTFHDCKVTVHFKHVISVLLL